MPEFEIQVRQAVPTLAVRMHSEVGDIPAGLAQALPEAWHGAEALGMTPAGPPYARYFAVPEGAIDYEGGVPLALAATGSSGRAVPGELPGGEVAVGWHVGPYETLPATYDALMDWVAGQGRSIGGPMWEVYWTNPDEEPDPARWRTEVIVPLAGRG